MPELPEVETIRRDLEKVLPGRVVRGVEVRLEKMSNASTRTTRQRLVGQKVLAVHRRAKVLLIHFSGGWTVVIHLKMSGQIIWVPARGRLRVGGHPIPGGLNDLPNKYSHVIFSFTGGTMYFNDQRQFGYMKILSTSELVDWLTKQGYGPEPLEKHFTVAIFRDIVRKHSRKRLKPTLLDQTVIAGIGNIYADETCFYGRVLPQRRIETLTPQEQQGLYRGLRHVLELSLKNKGTTAQAYRTATGQKGGMLPFLKVYGRAGATCRRCSGTIRKTTFVGRGTHFCPDCQR